MVQYVCSLEATFVPVRPVAPLSRWRRIGEFFYFFK
nr:MAG TPA: hypothetical protein [Caudoviricetes sp.]